MAVSTDSYFSNALVGIPQVGGDVNIYDSHATPHFAIGTKFERQDGAIFRYAHFGVATNRGLLVAPNMNQSAMAYTASAIIASNSVFQQTMERAGLYPNMVGSRFIVTQFGSITADTWAGGYISICSGTGIGYTYRIRHVLASSGTSCIMELYEPLEAAIDDTAIIAIAPSKYANVGPATGLATSVGLAVGVACSTIATSSPYGWIQTKGIVGVMASSALTIDNVVVPSLTSGNVRDYGEAVSGATQLALATELSKHQVIGRCVLNAATSSNAIIDLLLE